MLHRRLRRIMKTSLVKNVIEETRHSRNREDTHDNHDDNQLELLREGLSGLDTRSREILQKRFLAENKATLHELADEYGVSAERIRQLEANALKKMKALFAA